MVHCGLSRCMLTPRPGGDTAFEEKVADIVSALLPRKPRRVITVSSSSEDDEGEDSVPLDATEDSQQPGCGICVGCEGLAQVSSK
jgi:hypothetical protein